MCCDSSLPSDHLPTPHNTAVIEYSFQQQVAIGNRMDGVASFLHANLNCCHFSSITTNTRAANVLIILKSTSHSCYDLSSLFCAFPGLSAGFKIYISLFYVWFYSCMKDSNYRVFWQTCYLPRLNKSRSIYFDIIIIPTCCRELASRRKYTTRD